MKKIEQKVIKFIDANELIQNNEKILVALSGGPDSVFLLHFLIKFRRRFKIKILAAFHLNHSLRGNQADEDEEFCRLLCKKLKIEFVSAKKNVKSFASKNKISVEEAGRILRYKELEKYRKKKSFDKIATAHISNDNSETVLLNLIKGTGINGISGIPFKRGNIIRPVLGITKKEVLEYLNYNKINFRIDPTNLVSGYERNFLRNEIIPLIEKRLNPQFDQAVFKSSGNFKKIRNYLQNNFAEIFNTICKTKSGFLEIDLDKFGIIDEAIRGEFLRFAVKSKFNSEINSKDVINLFQLFDKQTGRKIDISGSLIAIREQNAVVISDKKEEKIFNPLRIKIGERVSINNETLTIRKSVRRNIKFERNSSREFISADNLSNEFIVRRWQNGDKFYPFGLNGSKKISDYLNEIKIRSSQKRNQLLLTNSGNVVWVIGRRIDDRYKILRNTKKVVELWIR